MPYRYFCILLFVAILSHVSSGRSIAAAWEGPFNISPISAPEMQLEAVGSGTAEGTVVSIGIPSGKANQKWLVVPQPNDLYLIRPSYSTTLVLAAAKGGKDRGTLASLETFTDKAWQKWAIKRNADGTVCLTPGHAPEMGLDDFGGGKTAGSRQDLWDYNPGDDHLLWEMKPFAGAVFPKDKPMIPTIKDFAYEDSKIFPGTRRGVTVFIPAEYDGSKPACVYVRQDGYNPAEKGMLEALIGAKEMPVTIGVFVTSGELPAPMPNTMGRRNRCFEYDGMGDNYVRFLTEELLPYVAKKYNLKLSSSGNDRCIAGGSSGGISAFNAAWERPDAFSRVYANSGSFVAFRGGHEFPTMIRKFEAKPIRAYLTTGTHDMENCAGDWYLLDQEMDKALKFSGYDYFFKAIEGGHVAGWNENFADAMRFIWKGWPEPVHAGPSAPRVRDVILPEKGWELVSKGFGDARGPACNSKGEVFFVDATAKTVNKIGLNGKVTVFLKDSGQADSLSVDSKDELITVSRKTGKIMSYDSAGQGHVIAEGTPGEYIAVMPNGSAYVTGAGKVWNVKDGKKTMVDTGLKHATGVAYRPDQWLLSVADGSSKWVYSYQINPDGSLINKERFYWLHVADGDDDTGAESICYSRENQMFVATRLGIQVCADDGPTQSILPLPDRARVVGVCLGGANQDTLFAFSDHNVWKRTVKVHAMGAFSPWVKANGSPL